MERSQLLDDIRVLTALFSRAEGHERRVEEADERDEHIDVQVTRLEHVAVKLERRLLELDGLFEDPVVTERERVSLTGKLERLNVKMAALRRAALQNDVLDATAYSARPPAVPARLRRTLYALVKDMHSDPTVPRADIRPFQKNLAHLVRSRRDALHVIAGRIRNARNYLTSTTDIAVRIAATAQSMSDGPSETLPFSDDRHTIANRVSLAQGAMREAQGGLVDLAHDWPELTPLAKRPDWMKLPFRQLIDLITPPDEARAGHISFAERAEDARQMLGALALWLNELESAVEAAPPPD